MARQLAIGLKKRSGHSIALQVAVLVDESYQIDSGGPLCMNMSCVAGNPLATINRSKAYVCTNQCQQEGRMTINGGETDFIPEEP